MKLSLAVRSAPILCLSLLAGCGATQSGAAPFAAPRTAPMPEFSKGTNRVFVSDAGTGDVYVYTLPALKLVEIVTGFTQPQGECSGDKGDVWVTDARAQIIYELARSGRVEKEVSDASGYPEGCAWDTNTGNLAVMNLSGVGSAAGAVLIYHHGSGSPNTYTNPKQFYYDFGGYDAAGNLFFDGSNVNGRFMLSELPINAGAAKTITVAGGTIYFPGMVQWDAASSYLAVGDQDCGNQNASCIYWVTIAKNAGTIQGQTNLQSSTGGQVCDLAQGVLWKDRVVGSDFDFCGSAPSTTYLWPYPGGGRPMSNNDRNDSEPVGAAISSE